MINPMVKKIIGVSGDKGSFSEEAGIIYAGRLGFVPDIYFSIDMEGVLRDLENKKIDLGIFPVVNSRGGLVRPAFDAMGNYLFRVVDEVWMEVHQCLMVLPGVKKEEIKTITTHSQAIAQCERYIKREFPEAKLVNWEDTAKAAKDLSEGKISPDSAVIAPSRSAQIYNLEIIESGIQDNHPNLTTFIVVERK